MSDDLLGMFKSLDDTPEVRNDYLHAPMNYLGNKYNLLDWILPNFPSHKVYTEVFGGSGACLLAKRKAKLEVFNDRYSGTTALYQCIQDDKLYDQLMNKIELMVHGREMWRWCRDTYNTAEDIVDRAVRYYYLVQTSFAGRTDSFGRDTFGSNSVTRKLRKHLPLFPQIHDRLKDVIIENQEYKQILKDYDGLDTLHYLDPPYLGIERYQTNFKEPEHIEMCELVHQLEGTVIISGFEHEIYDRYPWDEILINYDVKTNCTIYKESRKDRKEYLWIKHAAS
jgi:DNA adenine methylase